MHDAGLFYCPYVPIIKMIDNWTWRNVLNKLTDDYAWQYSGLGSDNITEQVRIATLAEFQKKYPGNYTLVDRMKFTDGIMHGRDWRIVFDSPADETIWLLRHEHNG